MIEGHISRTALGTYLTGGLSIDELEQVDGHLAACDSCREVLVDLTGQESGLLDAVNVERRRHLSYEQLECVVEDRDDSELDDLARQHLSACQTCQREAADLKAFDAVLAAPVAAAPVARPRPSFWRSLWTPALGLAGAAAAVALVVYATRPGPPEPGTQGNPLRMAVRLGPQAPIGRGPGVPSLRPNGRAELSPEVFRTLQAARDQAANTGQPQTIQITVPAGEYELFRDAVTALGSLDTSSTGTGAPASGATGPLVITLTIQPR